jgi:hypothetical protein
MKKIKRVLDPNNILNPGKIFDAPHPLPLPQGERAPPSKARLWRRTGRVRGKIFKT